MTPPQAGGGTAGFPRPFGKYTLLQHLAVGGMADVFLAQHRGPAGFEKECVIKRILPHLGLDQAFVQMFLDEARLSARLSHPNIVQIFDLGQVDGDYFLAMEYVDGVNLEQALEQARRLGEPALPWPVALRIVSDVAAGLDHAHNSRDFTGQPLGLVHRDVSPSNIMVSWGGAAKILDFGIAKANAVRKVKTEVGTIKGKVPYMSPEQLQGFALDGRSDVFSLGVILYEVTCGSRPFPGETTPQLTVQILNDAPRPPELLIDGYPPRLQEIVLRALAKRPEDRFQTARDLQRALEGLLAEEHVSCTSYDVEAYLRRLFPAGRRPSETRPLSGMEQTEVSMEPPVLGRVATPYEEEEMPEDGGQGKQAALAGAKGPDGPREVTGLHQGPQARLADPGGGLDDLEHEERRRRRGGGGMMTVIGLLVVGTAVGLYLLRDYAMGRGPQPAAADLAAAPVVAPAPGQAPPPGAADLAAAAPVGKEPPRPAAGEPAPKPPVKEAAKPPARERPAAHPKRQPKEEEPRSLPRVEPDPE